MMEEDFVKAQSDNLPAIDIFTAMEFVSSDPNYLSAEIKGVELFKSARESYRDEAIGYVQLKRDGSKCIVKCSVAPEQASIDELIHCSLVYDENENKVKSLVCYNCTDLGGCNHTLSFLIWLYKRNEEPKTSSVTCYWTKPLDSNIKFIKAKDFGNEDCSDTKKKSQRIKTRELKNDTSVLDEFVNECKKRNIKNTLMTYFTEPSVEMKASLHLLICKYKTETNQYNMFDFVEYCKNNITEEQCISIEKATIGRSDSSLWDELQYGRIDASMAYEASKNETFIDDLVERILEAYLFQEQFDEWRGKHIEGRVIAQVNNIKNVKIEKCGLVLSKEYPILCASPYGRTEEHVIDIKCPLTKEDMTKYLNFHTKKLTPKYEAQVQLHMHLTNKHKALFCIAHDDFEMSNQVDVYEILYNSDYCMAMIDECTLFWRHIFDSMIK